MIEEYKDYWPPKFTPKKYIDRPCKLCGWAKSEGIHKPFLDGSMGFPHHEYVPIKPEHNYNQRNKVYRLWDVCP